MRKAHVVAAGIAAVAAGLLAHHVYAPRVTPSPQPPLVRYGTDGLKPFAELFDQSLSQTRLLLMLSPT